MLSRFRIDVQKIVFFLHFSDHFGSHHRESSQNYKIPIYNNRERTIKHLLKNNR
jgi:hypothetical protein